MTGRRRVGHDLMHGCCSSGGGSSARPASSGFLLGDEDRDNVGAGSSGSGDADLRRLAAELCRESPASSSFQSYLRPSLVVLSGLSAVLKRSKVAKDADLPDLLASDFRIIAVLVDSASMSRSSAVIFRFLLNLSIGSIGKPGSRRRSSSSCFLRSRRFEKEITTNAVQAPSVRRAATAASIIQIRVESVVDVLVLESDVESRAARVKGTRGIVGSQLSSQERRVSGVCVSVYMHSRYFLMR